jgi:ribosome-associated translation inhibitor RaiA
MNFIEFVPIGKDIAVALAAMVGGFVGIRGLVTWRHQLSGNTEYRLAKDIFTCIYDIRDTIDTIRNPLVSYSCDTDLPKEKLETLSTRQREWQGLVQAYERRWRPLQSIVARLEANLLEAEVVWGKGTIDKLRNLSTLISDLHWAIHLYLQAQNPLERDESVAQLFDAKQRSILYGQQKTDDFKNQVDRAVKDIERQLKPHIERYHRRRS